GDLLGALIGARDPETGQGLSEAELVDNTLTFIAAGHETTTGALTWALYLIANDPPTQARLLEEARAAYGDGPAGAEGLERLVFHDQVLQEAMRLFPPAAIISRRAARDIEVGPVRMRKGDDVNCMIYVMHRSSLLWERPAAFDPERFTPERRKARHRFAHMPFGGGPRVCIGARFAMNEAVVMLATLVRRLAFEPRPGAPPLPRVRATLRPAGGMPLVLRPR
ncbi:MAG TPA: cytochrome P450, partial [Caulobacteraceae bacterium]